MKVARVSLITLITTSLMVTTCVCESIPIYRKIVPINQRNISNLDILLGNTDSKIILDNFQSIQYQI
jgi:hypothetical protein